MTVVSGIVPDESCIDGECGGELLLDPQVYIRQQLPAHPLDRVSRLRLSGDDPVLLTIGGVGEGELAPILDPPAASQLVAIVYMRTHDPRPLTVIKGKGLTRRCVQTGAIGDSLAVVVVRIEGADHQVSVVAILHAEVVCPPLGLLLLLYRMRALNILFGKVIIGRIRAVVSCRQVVPPLPVPQVKGEGMGRKGALPDIASPYLR